MKTRMAPELSTGAMSDIAFLLLIFFVTTTQILDEQGIQVVLPRMEAISTPVSDVAILHIHINSANQIMADKEMIGLSSLSDFLVDRMADGSPRRVISLHCDRETSYSTFIGVHDAIRIAYRKAWNEAAYKTYNRDFKILTDAQKKGIMNELPLVISEAD